jgi:hypothetical protein
MYLTALFDIYALFDVQEFQIHSDAVPFIVRHIVVMTTLTCM